jgi:hypothetical protein
MKHVTYPHKDGLKGVIVHWRTHEGQYKSKRMTRRGYSSEEWEADIPEQISHVKFVEDGDKPQEERV